jgi:hypothetical protein
VPLELRPGHIQLLKEEVIHHRALESIRSVLAVSVQIEELFPLAAHRFNNFVFKDGDSDFRKTVTDGDRHLFLRNTSQSPADRQRRQADGDRHLFLRKTGADGDMGQTGTGTCSCGTRASPRPTASAVMAGRNR